MAYYQEARENQDPSLLTKEIAYEGTTTPQHDEEGNALPALTDGKLYSVSDIIKQMIVYSDNDALDTLLDNADTKNLQISDQIFSDLKITSPLTEGQNLADFMSVDQYALIFRVLYGATYLSRTYSEQALGLLSQASYKDGLVAGVPAGVTVAHKYGFSPGVASASAPAMPELHDCGIIYYPGHPYILCVMTRGSDNSELQAIIKSLSAITYAAVAKLYPEQ
jgi:beta-lactamase class A